MRRLGKAVGVVGAILLLQLPVAATGASGEAKRSAVPEGHPAAAATRKAILGLDPLFRRVYRQFNQLEETKIDDYRTVGDLTGDRAPEILLSRWVLTDDAGLFVFPSGTFTGTVLNGATGKVMTSHEAQFVDGFAGLRSFAAGPEGKPGLLLTRLSAFSTAYTVDFTALDTKGNELWSTVLPSTYSWQTGNLAAVDALVAADVIDVDPGPASDLLIGQADFAVGSASVTDVSLIRGEDGARVPIPASETSVQQVPVPYGAADLDGDGSDDFVFVGRGTDDEGHVVAHSALDGSVIWSAKLRLRPWAWAGVMGDFIGDETSDLLVGFDTRDARKFIVVDGSNGDEKWSVKGTFPHLPGDIDRDGSPDLGMMYLIHGEKDKDLFRAYTPEGRRLYSVDHTLDASECDQDFCFTFGFYLDAGDLNGDRVRDRYIEQSTSWSREVASYLVNGRTGRVLHDDERQLVPVKGAVDGRGGDLGIVGGRANRLSLRVLDGTDLEDLWHVSISGPGAGRFAGSFTPFGSALRVTRDRCRDVLIGVRAGAALTLVMLDGRDGSPLWKRSVEGRKRVRVKTLSDANSCR